MSDSRKKFEAWAIKDAASTGIDLKFEVAEDWYLGRDARHMNLAWAAWQASREASYSEVVDPDLRALLDQFEAEEESAYLLAEGVIRKTGKPSISALQRHLKVSYERACRLMDGLTRRGVVSPIDSEGRRTILPVSVPKELLS